VGKAACGRTLGWTPECGEVTIVIQEIRVLWTRSKIALLCQHDIGAIGTTISEGGIDLQIFLGTRRFRTHTTLTSRCCSVSAWCRRSRLPATGPVRTVASSTLMFGPHERQLLDYGHYAERSAGGTGHS